MLGLKAASQPDIAALERLEALVRARYGVSERQIVLVTEERGRAPGLPDLMTTILFWDAGGARHRIRLFKPAAAVGAADLPPSWLRGAFLDEGEADCC